MNKEAVRGSPYFKYQNQVLVALYVIIYALYVLKYGWSNRPFPMATLLFYGLMVPVGVSLVLKYTASRQTAWFWNRLYPAAVAVLAGMLISIMTQFDPEAIQIGRYPALVEWVEHLVAGEFPYSASSKPSGFPFLFFIATPFYYLGEVGLLQVFGLVLFAVVVHFRYRQALYNRFRIMCLLMATPIFMFEVLVRSELIANTIIIIAALELVRHCHRRSGIQTPILLGLALGLAACTRGIALPAYLAALPLVLRQHDIKYGATLLLSLALGFGLPLLPFIVWNPEFFFAYGPFSIQLSHIPVWLLLAVSGGAAWFGLRARSFEQAYFITAVTLFGVVSLKLVWSLYSYGPAATIIYDDHFDLAYFAFTVPFLLLALKLPEEASPAVKLVPRSG